MLRQTPKKTDDNEFTTTGKSLRHSPYHPL